MICNAAEKFQPMLEEDLHVFLFILIYYYYLLLWCIIMIMYYWYYYFDFLVAESKTTQQNNITTSASFSNIGCLKFSVGVWNQHFLAVLKRRVFLKVKFFMFPFCCHVSSMLLLIGLWGLMSYYHGGTPFAQFRCQENAWDLTRLNVADSFQWICFKEIGLQGIKIWKTISQVGYQS